MSANSRVWYGLLPAGAGGYHCSEQVLEVWIAPSRPYNGELKSEKQGYDEFGQPVSDDSAIGSRAEPEK